MTVLTDRSAARSDSSMLGVALVEAMLGVGRPTAAWWSELVRRLDRLGENLAYDDATACSPGGLYRVVIEEQPRLSADVDALRRQCEALEERVREARRQLGSQSGDPRQASRAVTSVAGVCAATRAYLGRRAALVHEAFAVDLGGE